MMMKMATMIKKKNSIFGVLTMGLSIGAQVFQGLANYILQTKFSPLTVFASKILLEYSHTKSFRYFLWLFPFYLIQGHT